MLIIIACFPVVVEDEFPSGVFMAFMLYLTKYENCDYDGLVLPHD